MEKTKVLCLILALVVASAGTAGLVAGLGGDVTAPPVMPDNAVNTVMEKPQEGTPADRSAIENLYIAQGELQRKGGFVGTTRGTTTSAGIKQDVINNRVVAGGNVFKEMITVGVVKNAYQLYMYEGNYLYRKADGVKSASNVKWANTASKYEEADFLQKFGHRSDSLTGYILNDDTIKSGVLEKEENGLYQYRYVLDIATAPARMLLEMKTNSNMNGYSTFVKAEIIVVMDANWQVKTVSTDCKYKVPMFGGIDCVEDITETFSDLTSQDLPEKDFFEQFFNADVEKPVDKDPDALSILMDMFAPYIGNGNSLNASIVATDNGQTVLSGLVSAKIDIDNIQNIEVAAKLGDDLYVEYQQGKLYVTYQDFKASTTVDGIMGIVNAFVPKANLASDGVDDEEDSILDKFTYEIKDGICTVSLPLEVGEETIELNVYANVTEDGYEFVNAKVTFNDLQVEVKLAEAFTAPEHSGEYPEVLGLLDLIGSGAIYGRVNAFGMDVDVMFDLAAMSLYATSDDLSVLYKDNVVYAQYGAVKAKLNVNDVERIISLLRLAGIIDVETIELPQMSIEQILTMLGGITTVTTTNGVDFRLSADGVQIAVALVTSDNGWNVDKITATFDGNDVTLAFTAPTGAQIPEVNENEYADVMGVVETFLNPVVSLATASSYGADFDFDVTYNGNVYGVAGSLALDADKNVRVNAVVSCGNVKLVRANVTLAGKTVYLDVNGIRAAFEIGDLSAETDLKETVNKLYGVSDRLDGAIDAVYGLINTVANIDVSSIDFANVITGFGFNNDVLDLTVNADFLGMGQIDVALSVDRLNGLVVTIGGLNVANVGLDGEATVYANIGKIKAPNADDYVLNLKGSISDVEFALTADLLNMDISASVNAAGYNVLVRFVNGKVYAKAGNAAFVASVDELGLLIKELASTLGADVSALDELDFAKLDLSLETIIKSIYVNVDGALNIGLTIDGLANVSVNFDADANFVDVTGDVAGYALTLQKNSAQVDKFDVNDTYIPVTSLVNLLTDVYNKFKDVAANGVNANVNASVAVNDVVYNLAVTVNYNNGLYANVKLRDNANALVALDMYLVNNTLYLEVNGVRVATELPQSQGNGNGNVDFNTVLGLLGKAKGYNDVLDSVIEVIEQLPANIQGIDNYLDLLGKLSYTDGKLCATVNGSMLGLSDFDVTLDNSNDLTLVISNLAIGDITLNSLTADVAASSNEVTAPASEYVTELQVEVAGLTITAKLDLLNKTVVATTNVLNRELAIYFVNNTVYVKFDGVNAKLNVADVDKLLAIVAQFVTVEMPEMNLDVNVEDILNGITFNKSVNGYGVTVALGTVSATVSFDSNASFTNATVDVNGTTVVARLVHNATYPVFDLTEDYVDIVELADSYVTTVNNLINANGYACTLNGNVAIKGVDYAFDLTVNYNNGLYANVKLRDNANALVALDMYLVNNTLYLDVNGVRVATELPQSQGSGNGNVDLSAVLGLLGKAKGYNDVLDSVIEVVEQLPANFKGIDNYLDLLGKLSYTDGKLCATVNGSMLGLSDFDVTLDNSNDLTLVISNLAIGDITLNSLTADVAASSNEVVAPTSEYVTELQVEVAGLTITAKLDLLNKTVVAKTELLGHDMDVYYANGTVYVKYAAVNAKLNVADINGLVAVISSFVEGGIPQIDVPAVDVKQILGSIRKIDVSNGFGVAANVAGVDVKLSFDSNARLVCANVNVSNYDVKATLINGATYPTFDLTSDYVDLAALAQTFANDVKSLMNTQGYNVNVAGGFAFDSNVYNVQATVTYCGGLYVNANVSYNTANLANVELWLVDNVLYVSMGDLKLAIAVPQSASAQAGGNKLDLSAYLGYNPYVDGVLKVVQGAIDNIASNSVDYVALIDGLTFENGVLNVTINGQQLGLGQIIAVLTANGGLTATVNGLTVDRMTADFTATVSATDAAVVAPAGDFTTSLTIEIDSENVLYANLDLLNGVYNFRLDDLYATYCDNVIKIYKHNANGNDVYASGDINVIIDYVKRIDKLVNEFSGATESTMATIDLSKLANVDVKAIVSSLALTASDKSAILVAKALGLNVEATFAYGNLRVVTVPVTALNKTLRIEPCAKQVFDKFDGEHDYVQIEQVFNDYFPTFERLVRTNSWTFRFDGDTLISTKGAQYKIAAGSYVEFYYKNTEGMDTFKLRAVVDVYKQKSDGSWQQYIGIDAVYKDGNVYVTERGRVTDASKPDNRSVLRLTISVDSVKKCFGLYDKLVEVVPQIGELVENAKKAMTEAENNAKKISYSTILSDVSYVDEMFGLTLNGSSLLGKLGDIVISAQTYGNGLSLNELRLSYDGISVQLNSLRVYASEVDPSYNDENKASQDWYGGKQYLAVQDILNYDTTAYHMDFNSLYELLNSFVITATPTDKTNGTRSFFIEGEATVKLKIIGINLADIKIGLSVKVDITEDNKVYITAKIHRTKPSGVGSVFVDVYNDKGGDSYLYYDGVNETFSVIRNSITDKEIREVEETYHYCPKCDKEYPTKLCVWAWHNSSMQTLTRKVQKEFTVNDYVKERDFAAENLTTEQFTANIMDYILELFNFGSTIKDPIVKAMNEPSSADFGVDDIIKDYAHEANTDGNGGKYALKADLTPIDSNLGAVKVDIHYATNSAEVPDYSLTNLNVDVGLLGGMCQAYVPFELKKSTYGEATDIVKNVIFW